MINQTPTLSLVVPFYNVEGYIGATLRSISEQSIEDIEVLLVNDGSTDGSRDIAARFAAADGRFRLIDQENSGLGHARNVGAAQAMGKYLAFADSDDLMPRYAYKLMVKSLETTGSDLVAGAVRRYTSAGASPSPMHSASFAKTRLRTHITKFTPLVRDMTAWNKVFRRSFWTGHNLRFPEGILFEDAPATIPAHVLSRSTDILDVPVYYWRLREVGVPSITQQRTARETIIDRVRTMTMVSQFLSDHGDLQLKNVYDAMAIRHHFELIFNTLGFADQDVQDEFVRDAAAYLETVTDTVFEEFSAPLRLKLHLVRKRLRDELISTTNLLAEGTPGIRRKGLRRYRDLPYRGDPVVNAPASIYRVVSRTIPMSTRVSDARWTDQALTLRGHAFVEGVGMAGRWSPVGRMMWLRETKTRKATLLDMSRVSAPEAQHDARLPHISYEQSGFEVTVPIEQFQIDGTWKPSTWVFAVAIAGRRGLQRDGLRVRNPRLKIPTRWVGPMTRLVPERNRGVLNVSVENAAAIMDKCTIEDGHLVIVGRVSDATARNGQFRLGRVLGVADHASPISLTTRGEFAEFTARIALDQLQADLGQPGLAEPGAATDRWVPSLAFDGSVTQGVPVIAAEAFAGLTVELAGAYLTIQNDEKDAMLFSLRPDGLRATGLSFAPDGTFVIEGIGPTPPGSSITLRLSERHEHRSWPIEATGDGRWVSRIHPAHAKTAAGFVPLRPGKWSVLATTLDHHGSMALTNLPMTPSAVECVDAQADCDGRSFWLSRSGIDALDLHAGPFLDPALAGVGAQKHLREKRYPEMRVAEQLRDVVYYESFNGRQLSDSPLAVLREMQREGLPFRHLWCTRDNQLPMPEGVEPVPQHSPAWYEALATSRYIVTNSHLPHWFRRRDGQVVVQTWHGTPLKKIGFDIENPQMADKQYLQKVAEEAPNWSVLISPNEFSSKILGRAFHYDGEILEIGYPRNDILADDRRRTELRQAMNELLGLPADKKILLYAPTWRDDQYYGKGRYKFALHLNLEDAARTLGQDYVVLVRRHPNTVNDVGHVAPGFAWDVTAYPDMADLLAVADVLVTDYSSVMFDFANTGRPMIFFTYDLEHYRDKLRGFYFDFEAEAPGPLLSDSTSVIAAIGQIDMIAEAYAPQYRKFRDVFCHADDGHATARLIDYMLKRVGAPV